MRIMGPFTLFVLGVVAAIGVEFASDRSGTSRVLGSIPPPVWVVLVLLALLAGIGVARDWYEREEEKREELKKKRKDEKKPWYLRDI